MPCSLQSVRINSCAVAFTNSNCSCEHCDSATCFTRRRQLYDNCSCFKCSMSKTCLFHANNVLDIDESKSDGMVKAKCNECGLFTKCNHVHSSDHVIIRKAVPINRKISNKSCGKEVTYDRIDQMESPIRIPEMNDACGRVNHTASSSVADTASSVKLSRTKVQDDESATGKLSAQIMNVPYNDYKISVHKENSGSKINKWTTDDILNKIKEAYKACSCKVCECITMSSFQQPANDPKICKCKPCNCADCRWIRDKSEINKKASKSCVCALCIKKAYKEMSMKKKNVNEKCNCKPCECVQCKANATKICNCKPCECADCKASNKNSTKRTVIVAPVGEGNTRAVCTCMPCDCMACGRTYGTIATSLTHEMSTGMSRTRNCHCETCLNEACDEDGTEMCRCNGRDKLMRKPVQRDLNDYDIRSALIDYKFKNKKDDCKKSQAIAMYATRASDFNSHTEFNYRNKGDFKCNVCECVVCNHRFGATPSAFLPQREFMRPLQNTLPKVHKQSCKCSECECEICNTKDHLHGRDCKCKVCECLQCSHSVLRPHLAVDSDPIEICKCKPCECVDCGKQMLSCLGDNRICNCDDCRCVRCKNKNIRKDTLSPFQKGQLLGVSMAGTSSQKIRGQVSKYCENENHVFKSYERERLRFYNDSCAPDRKQEIVEPCHTNQMSAGVIAFVHPNNSKVSKSNLNEKTNSTVEVDHFSSVGMSRLSCLNVDSSSANNTETKKQLSGQSSCNSSGHDHSDYLIKFPRSAVETCINDVLKLNLDKKLNFTRLNVSSIGNSDNDYTRSPQYSIYCNKIKSPSGGYENFRTNRHIIAKPMPSNDWILAEGCKCIPCDCDKCTFSKMKVKRCYCDCMACDCVGSCISEHKSFSIRKNEGTQTTQKVLQDRGQDSFNKDTSYGIFERDFIKLNTQLYPLVANQLESDRNCESITIEGKKIQTYSTFIENPPKRTSNVNVYNMPIQINYNSVQSTIREAKEFSLQLLQILEKYEKANREFESISQKIKFSHEFMFDNGISTVRNMSSLETIAERENSNSNDQRLVDTQARTELHPEDTKPESINIHVPVFEPGNYKNEAVIESLHEIPTKDISENFPENFVSDYNKMQNTIEKERKGIESLSSYIFDEVCKKIFDDAKKLEFRDRYKKYRKLIKRAVSISRRFQVNSKNELVATKSAEVDCTVTDASGSTENLPINNELKQEDTEIFESIKYEIKRDDGTTRIFENNAEVKIENNEQEIQSSSKNKLTENNITEKQITNVMHKNDALVNIIEKIDVKKEHTENEISSTVEVKSPDENYNSSYISEVYSLGSENEKYKMSPLEADVKNTVHSISRQMSGDNNPHRSYLGNQALENLHTEVQKLLHMPQLQIQGTTYYFSEPPPSARTEGKYYAETKNSSTAFDKKSVEEVAHCSYKTQAFAYKKDRKQQPKPFASIPNFPYLSQPADSRSYYYGSLGNSNTASPSRSTCDALKVSFYGVRRVSDHTILVKWNPPQEIKDVQGYELLVDGRTVQKILSPTRCMAVVTCLPHSERVLLTVRTLTALAPPALCPATTFVYRPRVK